jgi:hypothetical protein
MVRVCVPSRLKDVFPSTRPPPVIFHPFPVHTVPPPIPLHSSCPGHHSVWVDGGVGAGGGGAGVGAGGGVGVVGAGRVPDVFPPALDVPAAALVLR